MSVFRPQVAHDRHILPRHQERNIKRVREERKEGLKRGRSKEHGKRTAK